MQWRQLWNTQQTEKWERRQVWRPGCSSTRSSACKDKCPQSNPYTWRSKKKKNRNMFKSMFLNHLCFLWPLLKTSTWNVASVSLYQSIDTTKCLRNKLGMIRRNKIWNYNFSCLKGPCFIQTDRFFMKTIYSHWDGPTKGQRISHHRIFP